MHEVFDCMFKKHAFVAATDQLPAQQCRNGKVRLVGGYVPSEGRVEICYGGQWGTMCGYESITTYSNVICRQLGYSPYGANVYNNSYFGQGSGGILLYTPNLLCLGNERTLLDCYHAPIGFHLCNNHNNDVGISCQGNYFISPFLCKCNYNFFVDGVAYIQPPSTTYLNAEVVQYDW